MSTKPATTKAPKLTATQAAVLEALANGPLPPVRLVELLDSKMVAIRSVTKSLAKRGLIVQDVETTKWSLVDTPEPEAGPTTEVTPEPEASAVVLTDDLAAAVAECRTRLAADATPVVVESKHGDYIKSAKVGSAWITTDGAFVCAKGTLEGTTETPWSLYRVSAETVLYVGSFKTSGTPFLVSTQADYR